MARDVRGWVAADAFDGEKNLYFAKPVKSEYGGFWSASGARLASEVVHSCDLPRDVDPKWSDKEPIEVVVRLFNSGGWMVLERVW